MGKMSSHLPLILLLCRDQEEKERVRVPTPLAVHRVDVRKKRVMLRVLYGLL